MVQMRWLVDNDKESVLQYRILVDKTMRAQPYGPQPMNIGTPWGQIPPIINPMDWTDWMEVPTHYE